MAFRQSTLFSGLRSREYDTSIPARLQNSYYVYPDLIHRLNLERELEGHGGCVNCLQWSNTGSLLASGSDDYQVMIWNPFVKRTPLHAIKTGHTNNIFSVQFVPQSNDRVLISGAGDFKVRVHDITASLGHQDQQCVHVYNCHVGRVKRLVVSEQEPNLFWSASEDGTVMQFDLRERHSCETMCNHVLINLNAHLGDNAEIKCIALNPCAPEQIAVGANDPFVRVLDRRMIRLSKVQFSPPSNDHSQWERHTIFNFSVEGEDYGYPRLGARFYVAGHLPAKHTDFFKRFRPLAATYVTFSPCGKDLLVNLGGEQIYLFNLRTQMRSALSATRKMLRSIAANLPRHEDNDPDQAQQAAAQLFSLNGFSAHNPVSSLLSSPVDAASSSQASPSNEGGHVTQHAANGVTLSVANGLNGFKLAAALAAEHREALEALSPRHDAKKRPRAQLSPRCELLKQQANALFEKQQYAASVALYSQAILAEPNAAVLYANRAAAYLKRDWDGDAYAALRDCCATLSLDPDHLKAHFRLARCLHELKQHEDARRALEYFKVKFPEYAKTHALFLLARDIAAGLAPPSPRSSSPKRKRENMAVSDEEESDSSTTPDDSHVEANTLERPSTSGAAREARKERRSGRKSRRPPLGRQRLSFSHPSVQERQLRAHAVDYVERFCGHCNTTTDIKEANFFGSNGQYIVAGSDDGSFFIWDRTSCNIVRILKGDESIVNCLQPHPSTCLLATSGIESVIRLWSPQPEGIECNRVVTDVDTAAKANQRRMNADPLEVMLLNMGYRTDYTGRGSAEAANGNTAGARQGEGSGGASGHGPGQATVRCAQS